MYRSLARHAASVSTALTAIVVGAAGVTVGLMAYVPAEPGIRTVEIGLDRAEQSPAEWTADVIRSGWKATDAQDRRNACAATPAQLRAAAPYTTYDQTRYDVETAITTLAQLCKGLR